MIAMDAAASEESVSLSCLRVRKCFSTEAGAVLIAGGVVYALTVVETPWRRGENQAAARLNWRRCQTAPEFA